MPAQQAQTVAMPQRLPLFAPMTSRSGQVPPTKDCRLINGYAEFDPELEVYWIYKRLGLGPAPAWPRVGAAGPAGGIFTDVNTNYTLYVTGTNLNISTTAGVPVNHPPRTLATVVGGGYDFAAINSSPDPTIFLKSATNAYLVDTSGTIAVTPVAGGFPVQTVPGTAYLDGTLYVMRPDGGIQGSNINDASTWNGLNVIFANSEPDPAIALHKQLAYVVALKQNSTQVFFDNGNPVGSPLSPVPDAQLPFGCISGPSVQSIDNTLLWCSSNENLSAQVVQFDNLTPKIVSTPVVEKILAKFGVSQTLGVVALRGINSWTIKHGGHRFYAINSVSANATLIYDLDQKQWYFWTDPNGNFWPIYQMSYGSNTVSTGTAFRFAQHLTDGNIYLIDTCDVFPSDVGVLFPVDLYTPNYDARVDRRKMMSNMRFNADQQTGSFLNVRYSNDDYQTWSNFRTVNLGQKRPMLPDGGSFYKRAYHIRHLCNTALRLRSVDLQMDIGTL